MIVVYYSHRKGKRLVMVKGSSVRVTTARYLWMMRGNSFYFEKMNGLMNLVGPEVSPM